MSYWALSVAVRELIVNRERNPRMGVIKEVPERGIKSDEARQIIYVVLAAGLSIAAILGFITAEQAEQILVNIVNLAGALGFGLAAANIPKPITTTPEPYDQEADKPVPDLYSGD